MQRQDQSGLQQQQQLSLPEEDFTLGGKQWRSVLSAWLQLLKALPCQSASLQNKEPGVVPAVMRVLVDRCVTQWHGFCKVYVFCAFGIN